MSDERRRVAREIHDGVAQDLAALGYTLDEVIADAEGGNLDVVPALRELRGQFSTVLRNLRQSIGGLRSGVEPGNTLGGALTELAEGLADRHQWQLHVDLAQFGPQLPAHTEAELFRIGQEALINVAKHAGARNVWLTCQVAATSILLAVEDDGIGMAKTRARSGSYGFVTMLERAQQLGASLTVQERRPAGTYVRVRLDGSSGRQAAAVTAEG